jgi:hypothetical protein
MSIMRQPSVHIYSVSEEDLAMRRRLGGCSVGVLRMVLSCHIVNETVRSVAKKRVSPRNPRRRHRQYRNRLPRSTHVTRQSHPLLRGLFCAVGKPTAWVPRCLPWEAGPASCTRFFECRDVATREGVDRETYEKDADGGVRRRGDRTPISGAG